MSFDKALAFTLGIEGGYSNRRSDRGGPTFRGVTQRAYDSWRTRHQLATQPVDLMTDDELRALYFEDYWTPCRCEEMTPSLGAAVFDMAVNSGATNAAVALQQAVSVAQDGRIGPETLAAAAVAADVVLKFLKARGALYRDDVASHPGDVDNLHGWISRLLDFQDQDHKGAFA